MSLFTIGLKAMSASQAALRTTGHNIANANTPGYSRQQVELQSAGGHFSGAGFFGRGVDIAGVTRAQDAFLAREVVIAGSLAAADRARSVQLQRLENVFATGESGIGYKAGELLNAFADVATRPQDASARQVVLARAADVADAFRTAGEEVDNLQRGVDEDLRTLTGRVTELAARVAEINRAVTANVGTGQAMNDLLDQREELVREIGRSVGVSTVMAEDGAMNVFIGGGQILVLGADSARLSTVPDAFDPSRTAVSLSAPNGEQLLPRDLLAAGEIGGLLRFQDEDLVAARAQLGQLATALATRVNEQQGLGLDLTGGRGQPLFSVGEPAVRAASDNAADAAGVPIASAVGADGVRRPTVSITVTDASRLRAAEYELRPSPSGVAGEYELTPLPGGRPVTVVAGQEIDGFRLDVGAPPPQPGDRFLLQPVSAAAPAMRREMDDPRGIAAAAPVVATSGTANTGTATANALRPVAVDESLPPTSTRITFGAAAPDGSMGYTWEQLDAGGTVIASNGGTWTPGGAIRSADWGVPQRVQWELRLAGVPRPNDTITVSPTTRVGPNNGNAEALLALRDERLVARDPAGAAGPGVSDGATVTDAWARAIADIGLRVQTARTAEQTSGAVADRASADLRGRTGVNLDEEAARLMQYQQSYQAAAKVLQVAQSVMDMLLRATDS